MAGPWVTAPDHTHLPNCRWIRATVTGVQEDGCTVAVRTEADWAADVPATDCHVQNERDDTLDDLVKSDYLHEAGCAGLRF